MIRGFLPGMTEKSDITIAEVAGIAVIEGDIELGPVKGIEERLKKMHVPESVYEAYKKKRKGSRSAVVGNKISLAEWQDSLRHRRRFRPLHEDQSRYSGSH